MKNNKFIIAGIVLILFGIVLFVTDALNPFVRPITHTFLMGSSKGKDIIFFSLFGFLLIASQFYKVNPYKINAKKFLLLTIISSTLLFAIGLGLELYLRLMLGIDPNTIFITIRPSFSTTSILHSHLIKSILGQFLIATIGPFIGEGINTGFSLYNYISAFTIPIVILIAILFVSEILSTQKRNPVINILLCFFLTILFIGCFDGGVMGTPGAFGLFGCILIYCSENNLLRLISRITKGKIPYEAVENEKSGKHLKLKRALPFIALLLMLVLRFSICIVGANPEYYEINIYNPDDGVNLTGDYPIKDVSVDGNKTTYHMEGSLNEMTLANHLSQNLNNSCDYFTVSWNFYSYI